MTESVIVSRNGNIACKEKCQNSADIEDGPMDTMRTGIDH